MEYISGESYPLEGWITLASSVPVDTPVACSGFNSFGSQSPGFWRAVPDLQHPEHGENHEMAETGYSDEVFRVQ